MPRQGICAMHPARAWSKRFTIGHDGGDASTGAYEANGNPHRYASLAHVSGAGSASNQVQRADFHFIKKSADTMERMGPIAWRLTSKTTGESHVIVSDKNGELHTKSCDGRFNDSGTGHHRMSTAQQEHERQRPGRCERKRGGWQGFSRESGGEGCVETRCRGRHMVHRHRAEIRRPVGAVDLRDLL